MVTVLFCDMVGSTELASRLDPEDTRELVRRFHEIGSGEVRRAGGTIAQYLGDGMMCHFGYPVAREDDAVRAVRAGLAIIAGLSKAKVARGAPRLKCRIGIATGVVITGDLTAGHVMQERTAIGTATNLAARLAGMREFIDCVLISADTRETLKGSFATADLGTHPVKGIPEPVGIWRVEAEVADAAHTLPFKDVSLSPIVGRQREIDLLAKTWDLVKSSHSQALVITGSAGVGKSRLVKELLAWSAGNATCVVLQCRPDTQDSMFFALSQYANRECAPPDLTMSGQERVQRLEAWVAKNLGGNAGHSAELALALSGVEVPDRPSSIPPNMLKSLVRNLFTRHFSLLAADRSLMVIVEDLQWADSGCHDVLIGLAQSLPKARMLLVMTSRREADGELPVTASCQHLHLRPITARDSRLLVEQQPGGDAISSEVRGLIVKRAGGVPLYLKELARFVLSSSIPGAKARGDGSQPIPVSLHGALLARLDQVGSIKRVAQRISALGTEFGSSMARHASGLSEKVVRGALARLVSSGVLIRSLGPEGEVFRFSHVLLRDAAYESMLRKDRALTHRRIASVLQEGQPHEVRALHADAAGMFDVAATQWLNAGRAAAFRSGVAEALRLFEKSGAALGKLSPRRRHAIDLDLLLSRGAAEIAASGWAADRVGDTYKRALTLAKRRKDHQKASFASHGVWSHYHVRAAHTRAYQMAVRFARLAQARDDKTSRVLASSCLGLSLFHRGQFARSFLALKNVESAFAGQHRDEYIEKLGVDISDIAACYVVRNNAVLAQTESASRSSGELLSAVKTRGTRFNAAFVHSTILISYWVSRSSLFNVRETLDELEELVRPKEMAYFSAAWLVYAGWLDSLEGERIQVRRIERGLAELDSLKALLLRPMYLCMLSEALLKRRDIGHALECLERAERISHETGDLWCLSPIYRLMGVGHALSGMTERSAHFLREAERISLSQDAPAFSKMAGVGTSIRICCNGPGDSLTTSEPVQCLQALRLRGVLRRPNPTVRNFGGASRRSGSPSAARRPSPGSPSG